MNLTLEINGINRTTSVVMGTLDKTDILNNQVDVCRFAVRKYGSFTYAPAVNDTVELLDGATTVFKGVIIAITKSTEGDAANYYEVECVDNMHFLDRVLVAESYTNTTIEDIIEDIITTYAPGFTTNNVDADIPVESILFNRISVKAALDKLAQRSNYSFYVDYDNDLHFFAKNTELAPFNITDTSANYIYDSLSVKDDVSQLRNRVFIEGGETEGDVRTEFLSGDGDKKTFQLSNKFASLPTVTVGGVPVTVGTEYLSNEEDFDAFWSYQEKGLRFKIAPVTGTKNIAVVGIPLRPVIVQAQDDASIATYGVYEFAKTDTSIATQEEARDYAVTQLEAYAEKISEGSFQTNEPGLRSGQVITVNSIKRGINESFLIQRVSLTMQSQSTGLYTVELATLRTITIIDFLIDQIRQGNTTIEETAGTILNKYKDNTETITISENLVASNNHNPQAETVTVGETFTPQALNYAVEFVLGEQAPSGVKRQFVLDGSPLA
jgi:hypothetical protein